MYIFLTNKQTKTKKKNELKLCALCAKNIFVDLAFSFSFFFSCLNLVFGAFKYSERNKKTFINSQFKVKTLE